MQGRRSGTGTGRRRSRQEWRRLVGGFSGSGLTLAAYCAREGIAMASFFRWRRLLGQRDIVGAATLERRSAPMREPAFVDLGAVTRASSRLELRLELGGGMVLQIARG